LPKRKILKKKKKVKKPELQEEVTLSAVPTEPVIHGLKEARQQQQRLLEEQKKNSKQSPKKNPVAPYKKKVN